MELCITKKEKIMVTKTKKTSVESINITSIGGIVLNAFHYAKSYVHKEACDQVIDFIDDALYTVDKAVDVGLDSLEEHMKSKSDFFCENQGVAFSFLPAPLSTFLSYAANAVLGSSCSKVVSSFITRCFDKIDDYYEDHMTPVEALEVRADAIIDDFCPGRLVNITLTATKRDMMQAAGTTEPVVHHDEL
jgi:hypothetical protein